VTVDRLSGRVILGCMKVLFFGDIIGKPGRMALSRAMPGLKATHRPDIIVANGENSAAGFGITEPVMKELFQMGVDVITTGNHVWDKKETETFIAREKRLLRPANFSPGAPGQGWVIRTVKNMNVAVINLQGRVMMPPSDCPFRTLDRLLEEIRGVDIFLMDFHAEATSEKEAMGRYADGRVAAIIGTHTHVQTADERILPKGAAFISDAGFCGGHGGVIGNRVDEVLERFLLGLPHKLEPEKSDPVVMGVSIEISPETRRALSIERIKVHL